MKVCGRCKKEKDENEFNKNKTNKDGLQYACKLCMKNYNLEYYEKNKEVINKRNNNIYKKIKENKKKQLEEEVNNFIKENNIEEVEVKPWVDPDSLFCDTEFLKSYIGLEVRNGKDCEG